MGPGHQVCHLKLLVNMMDGITTAMTTEAFAFGQRGGLDNISIWAQKLKIKLTEDEQIAVLIKVKQTSHDLKRVLTEEEFAAIVKAVRS